MGLRRGSLCRSLLVCVQHSCARTRAGHAVRAVCAPAKPAYVGIRQHTSASVHANSCVSVLRRRYVRQRNLHTSAYVRIRQHLPPQHPTRALPDATCIHQHSIRQHTSAYVSIRQHLPPEHSTRTVPVSSWAPLRATAER
jgi:hypothetical protein